MRVGDGDGEKLALGARAIGNVGKARAPAAEVSDTQQLCKTLNAPLSSHISVIEALMQVTLMKVNSFIFMGRQFS